MAHFFSSQKLRILALGAGLGMLSYKAYERHQVLEEFENKTPAIALYLDSLPSGLSNVEFKDKDHNFRTEINKTSEDPDITNFTVRELKFDSSGKVKKEDRYLAFTLKREGPNKVNVEKDPESCTCATFKYIVKHPYDLGQLKVPK